MTRKLAVLLAVIGLMVMAFAGVALAVTKTGGAAPNRLVGTAENDTLRGLGGADELVQEIVRVEEDWALADV